MLDRAVLNDGHWTDIWAIAFRDDVARALRTLQENGNTGVVCAPASAISANMMLAKYGIPVRLLKKERVPGEIDLEGGPYRLYKN